MQSQDWGKIRFLESTTNLKAIIKKSTGRVPSTEIARDIAACLQQGRLFFEIASAAPLQVQPLQIYYGIVGFAKAIILARNVQSIATIAQSHGLSDVSGQTSSVEGLTLQFRRSGLFRQFNDVVAPLGRVNYFDDNSMYRTESKPFDAATRLSDTTCSLKDVLGRIPGLDKLYQRTFSEQAATLSLGFYHRGDEAELRIDDPHLITGRNDLRSLIEGLRQRFPFLRQWCLCQATHAWDNTVLLFYNVEKPVDGELSEQSLVEQEGSFRAQERGPVCAPFSSILPALAGGTTNDPPRAIQPLNGANLSEFALQFCGAFLLSSLVRYRPQVWQHALSHSAMERRAADDRTLSIIEAFSQKVLSDFPRLAEKSIDWANSLDRYA